MRKEGRFSISRQDMAPSRSRWITWSLLPESPPTFLIKDRSPYYDLYSNAHRGKMRKAGVSPSPPPIIEEEYNLPGRGWAEMICKVYEMDPMICPFSGGRMRIITFIEDHKVIDRIIRHLELTFEAKRPPPPHHVQHELLLAAEERRDYF